MYAKAKRIAIIGAGWTGLGCLRVLKSKGYEVDIFEKNNSIGGVWHPENNYAGLRIHSPALTIEYHDFPLPNTIDRFERIHSSQVYNYLLDFCKYFDLDKNIKFNKPIIKISYNTSNGKSTLVFLDESKKPCMSEEYDYVVYTHGYCEKSIPSFKNSEKFLGDIYHSFSLTDDLLKKLIALNKKIVLIGGSKTATDFILKFYDYGYKVNWLVRKPYWFFNYSLRKKWLQGSKINFMYKFIFLLGLISCKFLPVAILKLWSRFGLVKTYGKKHWDFKKFHFGMVDENQIRILKYYYENNGIESDIEAFETHSILLKNGSKIDADCVICCTGSGPKKLNIELEINQSKLETNNIIKVYRARVIPDMPNLIFTAYHQFSLGTIDGLLQGNWIDYYIKSSPSTSYLEQNATKFLKPFFSHSVLFDSSDYIISATNRMYYPFFQHKEISTRKFLKWFLDTNFNSHKKIVPFEFKSADNAS